MSFKLVNDLFGEDKGDEVLVKVAGLIESKCEEGEVCARLRGDLFAVCIHKDHYDSTFTISASKELPGLINSPQFHLHIQGGVYNVTDKNVMVSAMVDRAHLALSTIKGSSERRMIEFDENLMARLLNEQQIITDFKRALLDREFHMFLQPQVSNKGEVKGAEALVRWIRPDNEIVSPGDFLNVLERTDLITDLDKYIWEEAAKTLASWKGTDKENLYISINISPKDFFYMDVYQFIHDLVDKYDLDKKKLKLEITETILMQDAIKQLALVNRLHDEGFDIEIDDFGKGYSSLSLLKDINADVLKIDKEFLQETQNSKRSEDILGTVSDMSDRLAMRVITEGVETREQLEKMIELGCYMFQGYYFAKPMSLEEFESKWTEIGASFNEEKLA
jgi:EAL domain-containing protein (putative c-di-GMP-specific phosphodiesterase class I)